MIDCFATGDYMKVLVLDIKIFFANMDMLEAFEAYRDENGQKLTVVKYAYDYVEKRLETMRHLRLIFKRR